MTITIRQSTAAIAILLIGVLGGLALGQVTQALSSASSQSTATSSYVPPFERTLKEINGTLKTIKQRVGGTGYGGSILDELDEIRSNTYGTCQAAGGSPFCHAFGG